MDPSICHRLIHVINKCNGRLTIQYKYIYTYILNIFKTITIVKILLYIYRYENLTKEYVKSDVLNLDFMMQDGQSREFDLTTCYLGDLYKIRINADSLENNWKLEHVRIHTVPWYTLLDITHTIYIYMYIYIYIYIYTRSFVRCHSP